MVDTELANHNVPLDADTATIEEYEQSVNIANAKYLAVAFFSESGKHQHTQMMRNLENGYLRGNKTAYPRTIIKVYKYAVNLKGSSKRNPNNFSRQHELGSTFVQGGFPHQGPNKSN